MITIEQLKETHDRISQKSSRDPCFKNADYILDIAKIFEEDFPNEVAAMRENNNVIGFMLQQISSKLGSFLRPQQIIQQNLAPSIQEAGAFALGWAYESEIANLLYVRYYQQ
jgi:hypothetical protein